MVPQRVRLRYRVISGGSSSVMASMYPLSFCGSTWALRGRFWLVGLNFSPTNWFFLFNIGFVGTYEQN
jgi:hypothetical protein